MLKNPRGYVTVKDGKITDVEWTGPAEDGDHYILIDENMAQWIGELKQEIKNLR